MVCPNQGATTSPEEAVKPAPWERAGFCGLERAERFKLQIAVVTADQVGV